MSHIVFQYRNRNIIKIYILATYIVFKFLGVQCVVFISSKRYTAFYFFTSSIGILKKVWHIPDTVANRTRFKVILNEPSAEGYLQLE